MLQNPAVRTPVGISIGAIAGALSRYYLGLWFTKLFGTEFPYSTLIINVSGCFVMGFFTTLTLGRFIAIHPDIRLLVTTGFLGSYTTFSTYELDTAKLFQEQSLEVDLVYWLGSAFLALLSLLLGNALAEFIRIKEES
ncbi:MULTISPECIES: fluoride efflux transporter CrcB [Fischerella]|uniref:Fluoride-specific ion channel FluC n=1 Tax=Fischerella muscicola CCMEE 5323 TaxID=2019572 RepID=A0A2N6K613_FISMU|nr:MULTISPECIES: fluoride efflux transporter CrcB [Fischerella]MBD2431538.1 fluoride efflux transporter CrcB [Fischerella sp. FACHB-380]PLZ92198.1 fluoride efflux transporter CrcB [Fischerella muscicola CCMEE 5323]